MAELNVSVVSAERALWSGEAKSLVAKTPEGEIGILAGHEPVLALLVEGPLRIERSDGSKLLVAIHGGFFSVANDSVQIIAELAELAEDIDLERAKIALANAQSSSTEVDDAAIRRAETRISVAGLVSASR